MMLGLWCLAVLSKCLRTPLALPLTEIFGRCAVSLSSFFSKLLDGLTALCPRHLCLDACSLSPSREWVPVPVVPGGRLWGVVSWGEISGEQAAGTARTVYLVRSLFGVVSGKRGTWSRCRLHKLLGVSCCGIGGKSLIAQLPWSAAGKLGGLEFWLEQHQNNFVILGCELILSSFKAGFNWFLEKKNLS